MKEQCQYCSLHSNSSFCEIAFNGGDLYSRDCINRTKCWQVGGLLLTTHPFHRYRNNTCSPIESAASVTEMRDNIVMFYDIAIGAL